MGECYFGGAGASVKNGTVTTTAALMQTLSISGFSAIPDNLVVILTSGVPQDSSYRQSVEYVTIISGVVSIYCHNNNFGITKRTGTAAISNNNLVITTPGDFFSTADANNTYKWWSF